MSVASIETRYAGCRFRSRLEARWAVFFDVLGVEWQYEPQRYPVGKKKRHLTYLPDFWLPKQRIWFEVKGSASSEDLYGPNASPYFERWYSFCEAADPMANQLVKDMDGRSVPTLPADEQGLCVLAYGDIPMPGDWLTGGDESMLVYGDYHYRWCRCDRCGVFGAEHCGRIERLDCCCYNAATSPDRSMQGEADLAEAYFEARSARFEREM